MYWNILTVPHGPMIVKFMWTTCLSFPRSCQILLQPPTLRITPFRLSVTACPQPACMSTSTCVVHRRIRPSVLLAQYVSCGTVREAVACRRFVCARSGPFMLSPNERLTYSVHEVEFLLTGEQILLTGEQFLLTGEQFLLTGEQILLTGEQILLTGEQFLLTGEQFLLTGEQFL
jgi:hypothetical protein